MIGRLHASAGRNPLARALQEYGRLVKTNFVLPGRADKQLERRVTHQLNEGEALHALRRYLFFAREGQPRQRHLDEHGDQALCLTLVVNAVLTSNTVYRYLQTLSELGGERRSAIVFPLPLDLIRPLLETTASAAPASAPAGDDDPAALDPGPRDNALAGTLPAGLSRRDSTRG